MVHNLDRNFVYDKQDVDNDLPENQALQRLYSDRQAKRPIQSLELLLVRKFPWWKRAMDIAVAMLGLVIFSPIMLVLMVLIKLDSKGPVFFKQKRVGYGGKIFWVLKFRSMYHNCDQTVHVEHIKKLADEEIDVFDDQEREYLSYKLNHDKRITPVGRFLRRTSSDELPQLFNVLKGEMSLVGPRPYPAYQIDHCSLWQHYRQMVKPGITGLSQIYARYNKSYTDAFRLDLRYVQSYSLLLDLKILLKTIFVVFSAHGAR
jgi:lipopolysaccharide/colanic/teichoic acid biosynthesis glycosyltransferase